MFAWWGKAVVRFRWTVLALGVALVLIGVTWGTGLFDVVTGSGFVDPKSESVRAAERIRAELGNQEIDLLVLYSSDTATVDDPAFRDAVTTTLDRLRQRPEVVSVVSWYETQSPALVSTDRHATYALVQLKPGNKIETFTALRPALDAPGLTTRAGGIVPFNQEANEQTIKDITRAELLSMPVLLVLLVVIFRGLVAAVLPLLVGGLAILGGFVAVRLLSYLEDISVFAINIITLLGLGMAIDYSLFVLSRFREELAAGHDVPVALRRTLATAGRTVTVSALTIALALASLLIFPQVFLRSLALGGISAVLIAMLASVTVLPALLAVLGPRVNAGRVRLPWRRANPEARSAVEGGWARLARSVMRRPIRFAVVVVALLLALAVPSLRIQFGGFDERVLPAGSEARAVAEYVNTHFPAGTASPIQVLVSGASGEAVREFATRVSAVPGVIGVQVSAQRGESTLLAVTYPGEPTSSEARDVVRALRDLPPPPGAEILVGGRTAVDVDLIDSLASRLPWMALIMASATFVLLFLAFGSVVLAVKAVVMNVVSIGASFGVVVWIFQDGHLSDLLNFTATGFIEPSNPILMLAVLFGLATDYEVFLLSRVREEWDRTGDNTLSVATGLQRTGRIITAAALLLVIVVAGFAAGGIQYVQMIGVGMIVAIIVDATLVRAILVPATMRLLGRWNWWAPGPLARVYRRYGIHETAEPEEVPAVGALSSPHRA